MANRVYFSPDDARRIAKIVKSTEREPISGGVPASSPSERWNPANYVAKTIGAVPAMTGVTPGFATAKRYDLLEDGTLAEAEEITVRNIAPAGIGANRWIAIGYVQGHWVVIVEVCV